MLEITARVPDRLLHEVDTLGRRLHRSRGELVRQALEFYIEELDALQGALVRVVGTEATPPPRRRRNRRRR